MSFKRTMDKAIKTMDASNAEKDANFRSLYKEIYRLADKANSFEEIAAFNRKYEAIKAAGGLKNSDIKLIDKGIVLAERQLKAKGKMPR